jgi:structure-specific endonuclease subunit SLX1
MYACYILDGPNHSYVGCTNNPARRLRQHNGEIAGGARYTRGKASRFAAILTGLPDKTSALQMEWAIKHARLGGDIRYRPAGLRAAHRVHKLARMVSFNMACKRCGDVCQHDWSWDNVRLRVRADYQTVLQPFLHDPRITADLQV